MAIFKREFIAVPDDKKDQLVFKWPDLEIRRFTRAIVAPDEVAVFLRQGQLLGTLQPGRYQVDATEIPFLGAFADLLSGGNMYRTELYFVNNRQVLDRFGGHIDEVQDPQTGMLVTLRVFGEYVVHVNDPATLIVKYAGTQDNPDNQRLLALSQDLLLRGLRTDLTQNIVRNGWPVLGLAAYTDELEAAAVTAGNAMLGPYGLEITRMANFTISLDDATEAQLRQFAKDTAYSHLAGSFQQYAAGEAAIGLGQGFSQGGGATGGAFLGAGLGMAGQTVAPQPPGPTPPPPPAQGGPAYGPGPGGAPGGAGPAVATVACPNCHTENPASAKFCSSCGTALPEAATFCSNCGTQLAAGAKFCANCGTPVPGAAPAPAAGAAGYAPPGGDGAPPPPPAPSP